MAEDIYGNIPTEQECISKEGKRVIQYSLDGKFIAEHDDVFVASKVTGLNHETIRDICKGRRIPRRIKFIFKFKEDAK